ncbi:MAG: choice-of-anchor J domain-containing protein [Janthinobacterium lividum]
MAFFYSILFRRLSLAILLSISGLLGAQAQDLNYAAIGATNIAGTYTDLGSAGTAIATANTDDANSAAQNIGFTFNYNGAAFTQFVLNTNGLIRLGSAPPSVAALYYDNDTTNTAAVDPLDSPYPDDVNLLMPFNINLVAGSGAGTTEYRVATTGTTGSRVCTVQWKNVADKAGTGVDVANGQQYANFSFQLKLYEANSTIEFVYGTATASTAAGARFPSVGLVGYDLYINQLVLGLKAELDAWSTTVFQNYNYGQTAHNISNTVLPDAGRTYRFTTRVPCTPALVSTFPYTENFDAIDPGTLPCGATVLDVNADNNSWLVLNRFASSAPNALVYIYSTMQAGNDWFFTPGLALKAGMRYQLQFKYRVHDASYPEALEVKAGPAATVAGQTQTLFVNLSLTNTAYTTTTGQTVAAITPTADGTYYIGFHAISKADMDALLVDDLSVTASSALATRGANNGVFSVQAAPVPFGAAGLSLTLNTLKSGPVALTLSDALGRAVRTAAASAPAGSSTITLPEIGSLSAGVYFLTVQQGGATQVIRVAHE